MELQTLDRIDPEYQDWVAKRDPGYYRDVRLVTEGDSQWVAFIDYDRDLFQDISYLGYTTNSIPVDADLYIDGLHSTESAALIAQRPRRKILREGLQRIVNSTGRYFIPTRLDDPAKLNENIDIAIEDYNRYIDNRYDYWHQEVVTVTLYTLDGKMIGGDALAGVESDATDAYKNEIISDLIGGILATHT